MDLRIKNLYLKLDKECLNALIVTLPSNISYLVGFQSRDAYLLVTKKKNIYFTDSRYTEEVKEKLKTNIELKQSNGSAFKLISQACIDLGIKRVGFEERYLPFEEFKKIKQELRRKTDLVATYGLVEELRQFKTQEEVQKIRKALKITADALKFIKKFVSVGRKEIEIAAELERFIRYNGASQAAFDIIVASGPNSSRPHHIPGQRKIRNNEPVLIDMGVDYSGYKSDLTRVFFLGKINTLASNIYKVVLEAQKRAIDNIRPDKPIGEIDYAARQYITQKGYGGFFSHNTGHGIGLDVHEAPNISRKETATLKPQMVFTVEPAIYLPNKFGIRIEDIVLVTNRGCEVLSVAVNK